MRPLPRAIFGAFAFLPTIGVTLIAALLSTLDPTELGRPERALRSPFILGVLGGLVLIALLQIALGIVVAIHTHGRRDLTSNEKMGWTLACLFVGSIALPMFFVLKTKPTVSGV